MAVNGVADQFSNMEIKARVLSRADGLTVAQGTQAAVIADPTGGATTDAEARAAINDIIDALQAFGIVATS